ncbi:pilus assembly protein CpaE [Rhizomonospora bruguierae]|uniref:pilus assembly protein CpaE n=1 Tax=Rhizomonospora bruguierae TaxID=1581705 RepID=UPI001BCD3C3E|nr:pilus assembly protein CpaE [Micromonospora sp. NBRC 107566]
MIPVTLAVRLHRAGLQWHPAPGDRFAMPDRDLDDDVFVLSDMTIQVYDTPDEQLIGFNGTVEWALDDIAVHEAIWLPREDQLRDLLRGTFRRLEREAGAYRVTLETVDGGRAFSAQTAEEAYGHALLHLIESAVAPVAP